MIVWLKLTTSGNKLSTFATYKIKQVAVRALENNGRTVRIPVYKLALMNKVKKMEGALAQKLGRAATIEEVAKAWEITATEVRECKKLLVPTQSLDVQVGEEEGTSMLDMIEDSENFVMTVEEKATAEAVDRAIASIKASDRDKQIIKMRFGVGTQKDGMTLEDIGKVYGITRERVRQIYELKCATVGNVLKTMLEMLKKCLTTNYCSRILKNGKLIRICLVQSYIQKTLVLL